MKVIFRLASMMLVVAGMLTVAPTPKAQGADIEAFVGQFVGRAQVFDNEGKISAIRDVDIEITKYKRNGLRIRWFNVTLVEGRRDVPGVQRRVSEVILVPHGDRNFFVEAKPNSPFRENQKISAIKGDPVRWAVVEDGVIFFYSFQKLPDDRFELQTYKRALNDIGLELVFERIVDGKSRRAISGNTVRAAE